MCELFGLSAGAPTSVTFSFSGFAARGGLTGDHVDGWGMGLHDGVGCRVFVDDQPAIHSPLASFLQQHPLKARTILAHVRKATQGGVALANCHPFQRTWARRHWLFAHNGDLKAFAPPLDAHFAPVGQTDSERAFCWLLQRLRDRYGPHDLPPWPELGAALHPWLCEIAGHGPFNMLLSDGVGLLAHASHRLSWLTRQPPFGRARLVDRDLEVDLAQGNGPEDRMALIASAPLTTEGTWRAFEPGESRLFMAGCSVQAWGPPTRTRDDGATTAHGACVAAA